MKIFFSFIIALLFINPAFSNHISGGELFYEYVGPGVAANTAKYKVTMRLFRDCDSDGQELEADRVIIGIYNANNNSLFDDLELFLQRPIQNISFDVRTLPCLTISNQSPPNVCYQVGIFTSEIDLPASVNGYTLAWIRCCRAENIANLRDFSGIGGTYVTNIPGTNALATGNNSSPQFAANDAELVCQNTNLNLDFSATDPDGDALSYSFCNAYSGGTSLEPNPGLDPGLSGTLNLVSLPYANSYSGNNPFGTQVQIDPSTGKITGTAPAAGRYVLNVCVTESRNGKVINQHSKDFIIEIAACNIASAEPTPSETTWCKDFKVNFSNNNNSSSIRSYSWDFGVPGTTTDVSTEPNPEFTYPDTGKYTIKLTVTGAPGCVDEATTTISVYPGFTPAFDIIGSCFKTPFQFRDRSTTDYGQINSWKWDFGDLSTSLDISSLQNPTYQYADPGLRNAKLVVTNTKGCIDSITKTVTVRDVALVTLPFKDTLICSIDTLQLKAEGAGNFTWSPAYNILNSNTANPLVYPKDTTIYIVNYTDPNGCSNTDSIKVNVLNSISVYAGADTTICKTDDLLIQPVSHGLQYLWTSSSGTLTDPRAKNQVVSPEVATTYFVTANLGKCTAEDNIRVNVVPYPFANAGNDARICYATTTLLSGSAVGSSIAWSPANTVQNPTNVTTLAAPASTTAYVLTVTDTLGCPKPVRDTVVVTVIPPVIAFAGNDTTIVANQPLQLNATGGTVYTWTPSTGMNNPNIANPVILLNAGFDQVTYKLRASTPEGCFDEDDVVVKVFKTGPDIFIPTAFTPNNDGKNDILKPILVGIQHLEYFTIFNRWGQKIYTTSTVGAGWDGRLAGSEQAPGTYVFMAKGTDYLGKPVFKKGTLVLIR